jgi:hypothetical protein
MSVVSAQRGKWVGGVERQRGGSTSACYYWAVLERRAAVKSVFSNGCCSVVDIATQLIRWTLRADARASRTGLSADRCRAYRVVTWRA